MISVEEALEALFSLAHTVPEETVPLTRAAGRVLARDVHASLDQPPFHASAMDGYAVQSADAVPGARLRVIGESAAGHGFDGVVAGGEAVRIFTGAPLPEGSDRVIIQEDVQAEGPGVTLCDGFGEATHVRPAGADFRRGDVVQAPRRLGPSDIALLAAMNHAEVPVRRRPRIALIATGDELSMPGEDPGRDGIIASNTFGLKALLDGAGADAHLLPIARDTPESLTQAFDLAEGSDLVVTVGGVSVGDHDLVGPAAGARGMERAFYKVAMRPGKPLMAGRMSDSVMVGLPGNPVSAMVCGHVFLLPLLNAMLGLGGTAAPRLRAPLVRDVAANGPRAHYMRANVTEAGINPQARQDSALLRVLAEADALLIRPASDGARKAGEIVEYIAI